VPTKYQVFVSSTYDDLKSERDQVIRAVLEMGHIPVGMEMFSAADEEQWKIIARHIDESDYYCVIVAHRYGSITDGISYTRKEYEYAVGKGIPVLGFLLDDSASWPADLVDKGASDVKKLNEFKALVKKKPVSFWKTADDLYGKVSVALAKQITANPREGWVRSSSLAGPEVTAELTRLSAENARLREALASAEQKAEADHAAEVEALWERLKSMKISFDYKYTKAQRDWNQTEKIPYAYLFYLLGSAMVSEVSVEEAANSLAMHLRKDKSKGWWTVATNQMRNLFADFMALGLAEPSKRKHAVADKGAYWSLTDFGLEMQQFVRRTMLEIAREDVPEASGPETSKPASSEPEPSESTAKRPAARKTAARKPAAKKN